MRLQITHAVAFLQLDRLYRFGCASVIHPLVFRHPEKLFKQHASPTFPFLSFFYTAHQPDPDCLPCKSKCPSHLLPLRAVPSRASPHHYSKLKHLRTQNARAFSKLPLPAKDLVLHLPHRAVSSGCICIDPFKKSRKRTCFKPLALGKCLLRGA